VCTIQLCSSAADVNVFILFKTTARSKHYNWSTFCWLQKSVIFCVHCFNILFLLAFTYSCFLCDSAAIMWCETLLYRTVPYFHIHISVSSHLKLTCCVVNADFVLQPTLGDSSVAMLYSSLCSLLVLGDDLSHIDRTAVCETLRHLQEQFDRSGCSQYWNVNVLTVTWYNLY